MGKMVHIWTFRCYALLIFYFNCINFVIYLLMYNYINIFWKGSFEYGTLVQIIEHRFQSMSQTKSLNLDQEVLVYIYS